MSRVIIVIIGAIIISTAAIRAVDRLSAPDPAGGGDDCPDGMVFVAGDDGGFCIDKYEASPAPECPYASPNSANESRANLDDPDCRAVSAAGASPWRFLSYDQAVIACANAGKRLPRPGEWFRAALGTPDPDSGRGADDCQLDSNWEAQPGPAGSAPECVSAVGAHDMVGNVWEWVRGAVRDGSYEGQKMPGTGYITATDGYGLPGSTDTGKSDPLYYHDYFWLKDKGIRGLARGGYWDSGSDGGIYSVYASVPTSYAGPGIGFRCVK